MNNPEEPAFPDAGRTFLHQPVGTPVPKTPTGLTKLEYAAIHLAAGLSGNAYFTEFAARQPEPMEKIIARMGAEAARALFAELEKPQQ